MIRKKISRRNYWGRKKEKIIIGFLTYQVISKVIIIILPITVMIIVNTYWKYLLCVRHCSHLILT